MLFTNDNKYVHTCSQKLKCSRDCKNLQPIRRSIYAHFSYSSMQLKQQILVTTVRMDYDFTSSQIARQTVC